MTAHVQDLTVLDLLRHPEEWFTGRTRMYGLYPAEVVDNGDPEQRGRVRLRVHGMHKAQQPDVELPWALPLFPTSGPGHGHFELPSIGDTVLVTFWAGSVDYPFWVGSHVGAPGGKTELVAEAKEGYTGPNAPHGVKYPRNAVRKTAGGIVEERDDTEGQVRYHIRTPKGHSIVLFDDDEAYIKLETAAGFILRMEDEGKVIRVQTPGGQVVELLDDPKSIKITTTGDMTTEVQGNSSLTVEGNADINVKGSVTAQVEQNLEVEVAGAANVEAQTASVKADAVELGDVTLPFNAGLVTGQCIDPFTGNPFPDVSGIVRAKKL